MRFCCLIVVMFACCISLPLWAETPSVYTTQYWPSFPVPDRILISEPHTSVPFETAMVLTTLSGLAAYDARSRNSGELIWIGMGDNESYAEWFSRFCKRYACAVDKHVYSTWELVDHFRDAHVLKGYILYAKERGERPLYEGVSTDMSANVATALCAILGGIAVEESLEETAKAHQLPLLADVRGKDERWVWQTYGGQFSTTVLGRQDPKSHVMRDALVAMRTMIVADTGPLYEDVLKTMRPGSPLLGWGIGLEDAQTGPCSRYGLFQTATNWCTNLPFLSAGETGMTYPLPSLPEPERSKTPDNKDTRYVSFILSDGDNVQWLMLNFCTGKGEARQYWGDPARGSMPFGWTIPAMDLAQVCPYTLDYLKETATSNDDFVLLGGGYYYPDWYGSAYPDKTLLAAQAQRIAPYMQRCGVRLFMINCQDWKSPDALKAYSTYAQEIPTIKGIFAIQYAPYTGGKGQIRWVSKKDGQAIPVLSARNALWSQRVNDPQEGSPSYVASLLNDWASKPVQTEEDRFAWIIVHAWSWFAHSPEGNAAAEELDQATAKPGDTVARGYRPAVWCKEHLASSIQVVTPSELVDRLCKEHAQ